jgi:hypothetical protein
MKRDQIELRYMQRKSARSLWVWVFRARICDTPAVGPVIMLRLFGWTINLYPWMHSHAARKTLD